MKPMLQIMVCKEGHWKLKNQKIVWSCELGKVNINKMFLTHEIAHDYKRSKFKSITSPIEFTNDFVYLNHSET